MRQIETVVIPAQACQRVTSLACDICGAKSPSSKGQSRTDAAVHWQGEEPYLVTTVSLVEGDSESDSEECSCDICPDCFRKHVMDHLTALGVVWRRHVRWL